ncbi:uncharacterized protein LOC143667178 isoform X4 [Tamandua tetradactyla]|uniref:uncharacterized protein LOC143667178 isoform X4 n=1 Tax=Tamandua tetradactyla TaxID=48850 RepID=UPI004054279C
MVGSLCLLSPGLCSPSQSVHPALICYKEPGERSVSLHLLSVSASGGLHCWLEGMMMVKMFQRWQKSNLLHEIIMGTAQSLKTLMDQFEEGSELSKGHNRGQQMVTTKGL